MLIPTREWSVLRLRTFWPLALLMVVLAFGGMRPAFGQSPGVYYTVRSGESLTVLSQRFNVPVAELARANRISPSANLAAGTRIWVPLQRQQAPTASRPPSQPQRPATRQQPAPATRPTPAVSLPSNSAPSTMFSPRPSSGGSGEATERRAPERAPESGPDHHVVQRGESLWSIANRYGLSVDQLTSLNSIARDRPLQVGQRLRVSGAEVPGGGVSRPAERPPQRQAEEAPPTQRFFSSGRSGHFIWPAEGRVVRTFADRSDQKFTGIDIAVPRGTEVRAARSGKVVFVGDSIPGYGLMVIVAHDNDYATCYAHTSRALVREGQQVSQGQVIARSGDSGRGSTPFLRFEVRKDGEAVNPVPLLP